MGELGAIQYEGYDLVVTEGEKYAQGWIEYTADTRWWVHEIHHRDGRVERFITHNGVLYEDNP